MSSRVTTQAVWPSLRADSGNGSHPLEQDLVALFDQFREPLLRYLASFGLPIQDGEEIVQEVFLALFRHLKAGKSRSNLRGWLFRVAHNLALKRRLKVRRDQDAGAEELAVDSRAQPGRSVRVRSNPAAASESGGGFAGAGSKMPGAAC